MRHDEASSSCDQTEGRHDHQPIRCKRCSISRCLVHLIHRLRLIFCPLQSVCCDRPVTHAVCFPIYLHNAALMISPTSRVHPLPQIQPYRFYQFCRDHAHTSWTPIALRGSMPCPELSRCTHLLMCCGRQDDALCPTQLYVAYPFDAR